MTAPLATNTAIIPLRINGVTITDLYHFTSMNVPMQMLKTITYPYAIGRKAMLVGSQQTDESSLGFTFSSQPPMFNRIYGLTYDAVKSQINAIVSEIERSSGLVTVYSYLYPAGIQNMFVQFKADNPVRPFGLRDAIYVGWDFSMSATQFMAG